MDEDIYIDVLEGRRQFDPLWRFHAPIAAAKPANCQMSCSLFPTMNASRECGETETQARTTAGPIKPLA